ncbi:MAG: metallophosphoesterase [Fimbriimonadaceae bacterium]|nr:metallophosphoesterase [Fimbriimonadaceae bacterium]
MPELETTTVRFIHFSDLHGKYEAQSKVETAVARLGDRDVLINTGDDFSSSSKSIPLEWDNFSQRIKIAVAGQHDTDIAGHLGGWLQAWQKCPSWQVSINDRTEMIGDGVLAVISNRWRKSHNVPFDFSSVDLQHLKAVVVVCHELCTLQDFKEFAQPLYELTKTIPICIFNGHDHSNPSFERWGDKLWRSTVISGDIRATLGEIGLIFEIALERGTFRLIRVFNAKHDYRFYRTDLR